jgi:hypothetical protein
MVCRETGSLGSTLSLQTEAVMGLAIYEILGSAGEWRIRHDGHAENVYETKESAFEAAAAAASLALRQGHEDPRFCAGY